MTLDDAKILLSENNIEFNVCEYENEATYWHHKMLFPYTKNARNCKVTTLVIVSKNKKKNIELLFNYVDNEFCFEELCFGDYSFEMFDYNEEKLPNDLQDRIKEIQSGNFVVIIANDLKNRRWLGDAGFDLSDNDDAFDRQGFEKAMRRINKPKGLFSRLFRTQKQYEIYDWNSYQCIVK